MSGYCANPTYELSASPQVGFAHRA